jgi:hypothetical protein
MRRAAMGWFGTCVFTAATLASGAPPSQQPSRPGVTTLGSAVAAELRAFCDATTLGTWRRVRPGGTVRPYERGSGESPGAGFGAGLREPVALTASAQLAVSGVRRLSRTIYFYAPALASGGAPPAAEIPAAVLADQAVAGYLWIEAFPIDPEGAQLLTVELQLALDQVLGAGDGSVRISAFGSAMWRDTRFWRRGTASIAAGWRPGRVSASSPEPARVIIVASLPPSASPVVFARPNPAEFPASRPARLNAERTARTRARVDEAIALAGVGGPVEETMRALLPYVAPDVFFDARPAGDPDELLRIMRDWMTAIAPLPPPRRSAGLLVADQILQGAVHPFQLAVYDAPGRDQSAARRKAFVELGAAFTDLHLGATYLYTNTWLKEALALDPDGRAGELAFLVLLEKGFETSGVCADQNGEGFMRVISRGEAYLATGRGRTSPDRANVLFAIAQANSDVVAMATGHGYQGPGGAEATAFAAQAPAARREALRYYRLALAEESGTERAADALTEVWRLSAGLSPARTYFYCVYD